MTEEEHPHRRFDDRLIKLEAEVAEARAELRAVHTLLEDLRSRIQAPRLGAQISVAAGVVLVLVTLGTMALRPLEQDVAHLKIHDADGHPEAVIRDLHRVFDLVQNEHEEQEHDIEQLRAGQSGLDERITSLEIDLARAHEQLIGARNLTDLKSQDRWTARQHRIYAEGIERRLSNLEQEHD